MYVYIRSEPGLYTVGFYSPDGEFHTDSDHHDREDAAKRVRFLNGGKDEDVDPTDTKARLDKMADIGAQMLEENTALKADIAKAVELLEWVRRSLIRAYLQGPPGQTILGEIDDFIIKRKEASK